MAALGSEIRASDTDRATAVTRLQRHYTAGCLTLEEYEERTQAAYRARTLGDLDGLLSDLPPAPLPPAPPSPAPTATSRVSVVRFSRHGQGGRSLPRPLTRFISLTALLVGVWALTGRGYFWPAWPMLVTGVGLLRRFLKT